MSMKLICFVTEFKVGMEIFKICPRNFTGELAKKLCKNGFITDFAAGARALCDTLTLSYPCTETVSVKLGSDACARKTDVFSITASVYAFLTLQPAKSSIGAFNQRRSFWKIWKFEKYTSPPLSYTKKRFKNMCVWKVSARWCANIWQTKTGTERSPAVISITNMPLIAGTPADLRGASPVLLRSCQCASNFNISAGWGTTTLSFGFGNRKTFARMEQSHVRQSQGRRPRATTRFSFG